MTTTRRTCCDCSQPTEPGMARCWACSDHRARSVGGHVPAYGEGRRLVGRTATCSAHGTRGCPVCFSDVLEAVRVEAMERQMEEVDDE